MSGEESMIHGSIGRRAFISVLMIVLFAGLFIPFGIAAEEPKKLYGLMSPEEIQEQGERQRAQMMMRWDKVLQEQETIRAHVESIAAALIKLDTLEEKLRLLEARAGDGEKKSQQPGGSTGIDSVRRNRDLYLHEVRAKLPMPQGDYGQIKEYMRALAGKWQGLMYERLRLHGALWAGYQPQSPKEGALHWDVKEAPLLERRYFFMKERFELTRAMQDPRMMFLCRYEPGKFPFVMPSLLYWYGVSIAPRTEAVEMFNKKMKESAEAKSEFNEKYLPAMDVHIEALKKQAAEAEGDAAQ